MAQQETTTMAYKFPSKEWVEAYKDALNGEPGKPWQEAAKTWEGDFLFIVDSDGPLQETNIFYIDLWHGECRNVEYFTDETKAPQAEFTYQGPYTNWLKLIKGEIDPIKGILMRKFKLKGNKAKVMKASKAAKELVATAQKIESEFL